MDQAGLKNVHPHDLRRTCGSWLVQAGVPIQAVSALMRHSDSQVTVEHYAHLSQENIRAAVDLLSDPVLRSGFTLPKEADKSVNVKL